MFPRRWLSFLALLLCGCQAPPQSSAPPRAVSTAKLFPKDDLGREIALKSAAQRVIVISPGAVETVFALGAGKQIVGRDSFTDFPPEAKKIAVAGDFKGPSVEKSIALRPDLVILQGETWDKARVEKWQQQIGVPVAALTPTNLAGVSRNFAQMGAWLGSDPKRAQTLAASLRIAPVSPKKSAFIEIARSPLWSAGSGTLVDDVLRAGGFSNVAASVKGYQPFGLESLLVRQPAVYVVTSDKPGAEVVRELRVSPALSKLESVREGRVLVIKSDFLLRPGPRLKQGVEMLRKANF